MKWTAVDSEALASYVKNAPLSAGYLSPSVQKELIDCFATLLRSDIIAEAMKSDIFSMMAASMQSVARRVLMYCTMTKMQLLMSRFSSLAL